MQKVLQLEEEFGKFAGYSKEQTVACSSGTSALHLALEALKLPLGSEVILCDFNMVACARAVTLAGLKPVFVDCDKNLLINPSEIVELLDSRRYATTYGLLFPSAILCTHIYGRPCNMQAIHDIAGKYDLKVLEDLAEAHGLPPHSNTDAACWSFYRNKIVAGEEGGAVGLRDEEVAARARCLRSLGFGPDQDYQHIPRGHNYRLANCLAEKVLESLKGYKLNLRYRREMEGAYDLFCPDAWKMPDRFAPWVYDIRIPELSSTQQYAIVKALKQNGTEARHAFKPMSVQEEYKRKNQIILSREFAAEAGESQAEKASREVIYLPLMTYPIDMNTEMESIANQAFATIKTCLLLGS